MPTYTCQRVGCGAAFTKDPKQFRVGESTVYCPACEAVLAAKAKARRTPGMGSARDRMPVHRRARGTRIRETDGG